MLIWECGLQKLNNEGMRVISHTYVMIHQNAIIESRLVDFEGMKANFRLV